MEKEVLTALKGRPNSVKIVEDGVYETLSFVLMTLVGIDLLKLREIVKVGKKIHKSREFPEY